MKDTIKELSATLRDSDPDALRRSKASLGELSDKIAFVKRATEEEQQKVDEIDKNILRLRKQLDASGAIDLRATALRANILRTFSRSLRCCG